jgi:hypothetical protein
LYSKKLSRDSYLFFGPRPVSTCGHLPSTEGGRVRGLGVHLRERREDLGLVVKHSVDGCCSGIVDVEIVW